MGTSWPNGFRQGHPVGGEVQDPLQEGPQDRERVRQASREAVPFPGAPDGCQVQCRCVETSVHVAVQPPAYVDLQDRQGDEGEGGEDRSGGGLGDQRRAHARRRGAQGARGVQALRQGPWHTRVPPEALRARQQQAQGPQVRAGAWQEEVAWFPRLNFLFFGIFSQKKKGGFFPKKKKKKKKKKK